MTSTFDQLVADAQPTLAILHGYKATEGRSWEFSIVLKDADLVEYDMPTLMSGGTSECKVVDEIDGTVLVTMTVTFPGGGLVKWTAAPSDTAGTAGNGDIPRIARWYMTLTNSAGRQVEVFGVQDSKLVINQE